MRRAPVALAIVAAAGMFAGCADVLAPEPARPAPAEQGSAVAAPGATIGNHASAPGSVRIIIREGSMHPGPQPLWIVDGRRMTGLEIAAAGVRVEDIAEIRSLKAPAAMALYGRDAAYGVVFIRTRSGSGTAR